MAQADAPYRDEPSDIGKLRTRSTEGVMVAIGLVATLEDRTGPTRLRRYYLYNAVEIQA